MNCDLYQRDGSGRGRGGWSLPKPDERLLVHLSNFRPVKRVTDVVEIFDRVQKKIPARLMMIGDGPDRRAAERLACAKGIHQQIHFLGKQDMIHEKLAMADVMLLPSEMESFGLAALEAMACEVVPVASRVGGLPEVIERWRGRLPGSGGRRGRDGRLRAGGADATMHCWPPWASARGQRRRHASAPRRSSRNTKSCIAGCWSESRSLSDWIIGDQTICQQSANGAA